MENKRTTREIPFAKVGRRKQHAVSLFKLGEREFDIADDQQRPSFAKEALDDISEQCTQWLCGRGIELGHKYYVVDGGKVVPFQEGIHEFNQARPLVFAIETRDKEKGQTGDLLAALALDQVGRAYTANCQLMLHGPDADHEAARLHYTVAAQDSFFKLALLTIQPQYSAGARSMEAVNGRTTMQSKYEAEVITIFVNCNSELSTRARCTHVAAVLKKRYGALAPSMESIRRWVKARNDLC